MISNTHLKTNLTVGIIGAGVSGMSSASMLKSKGFGVKIFEASDRFGGRLRKLKNFAENFDIELGGEEIHGNESHYVNLIESVGGKIFEYWKKNKFYVYNVENKKIEDIEEVVKTNEDYRFVWELFEEISYELAEDYPDMSLKQFLDSNKISKEVYFLANAVIGVESGTDLNKISIKGFSRVCKEWKSGISNYFLSNMSHIDVVEKAYGNIIENIVYSTPIMKIDYTNNKVELYDMKNEKYECDYCIITTPINQLRKINFTPELNSNLTNTINTLQLDNCAKIILKFKERFWNDDTAIMYLPGRVNMYWPLGQSRDSETLKDFILTGLVSGESCRNLNEIYKTNKETFIKTIISELQTYVDTNIKLENILIDYVWFSWTDVPFIEGGYTYPLVNENNIRDELRKSVNDKLFFAGEACARNGHISTIHGAIESSIEVVNMITEINSKY
jgi:polyamine oxidase